MEKKVLLFSGGMDCLLQAPFIEPDVYLYVNLNTQYSKVEIENLKTLPKKIRKKLIITKKIDLSDYEQKGFYLPYRNLILIALGMQYGQHLYFGFNEADVAPDKDEKFLNLSHKLFKHLNTDQHKPKSWKGKKFSVNALFMEDTKTQMVKYFLDYEHGTEKDVQNIRTCYHAKSKKGCGECVPCINKAVALINNYIDHKGLFDKEVKCKDLKEVLAIHKKFRPDSNVIQEFKDAIKIYKAL